MDTALVYNTPKQKRGDGMAKLLSTEEAAAELDVSISTLKKHIHHHGMIEPIRIGSSRHPAFGFTPRMVREYGKIIEGLSRPEMNELFTNEQARAKAGIPVQPTQKELSNYMDITTAAAFLGMRVGALNMAVVHKKTAYDGIIGRRGYFLRSTVMAYKARRKYEGLD